MTRRLPGEGVDQLFWSEEAEVLEFDSRQLLCEDRRADVELQNVGADVAWRRRRRRRWRKLGQLVDLKLIKSKSNY